MRQKIISGNWKMHGTRASVAALLETVAAKAKKLSGVDWLVFPPFVFLEQTESLLKNSSLHWGGQNVSEHENGAYTGEISVAMLAEFGCTHVLVGHSERRALYGETNVLAASKFAKVQAQGLTPVLCVGETLAQRQEGQTLSVVLEQLDAVLALESGVQGFLKAVVAYEPVWAIGTGLTATPQEAEDVHYAIRQHIAKHQQSIADKLSILYGGSVKADNAAGLFAMHNIDGALVGGASLKADEFLEIGQALASSDNP